MDRNKLLPLKFALNLRDNGFPQPDFEFGQYWETEDGTMGAFVGSRSWPTFEELITRRVTKIVFIPKVDDILRQMPKCSVWYDGRYWTCTGIKFGTAIGETAALAAAGLYLSLYETKII